LVCYPRSRPRPSGRPSPGSITARRGGAGNRWRRQGRKLPQWPPAEPVLHAFDQRSPFKSTESVPMQSFQHGDVEIAYLDEGEGEPIVLVHGFASSKNVNW